LKSFFDFKIEIKLFKRAGRDSQNGRYGIRAGPVSYPTTVRPQVPPEAQQNCMRRGARVCVVKMNQDFIAVLLA
jgi:hypothetical protein